MFVNTDCGTQNKAGVDRIAFAMRDRFRDFGAEVEYFPQTEYGDCLYGRWRGKGKARILLIGHMDTVYSDGAPGQFPFRRRGSRLMGPGVNDMKAGLLNGLYALHGLVESGFDAFEEIGLFCNSEEEVGSPVSRELHTRFARGADAALILEPARSSGAIVSGRKGVGQYVVKVHGRAAHAGVEPEKGANAILALARHTEALAALNGTLPGVTLNVGVVRGGTRPNVIADFAQAEIDVRIPRASDTELIEQAMRAAIAREVVPGTTAELSGGIANPPMEKTENSARLVAFAKESARELGFEIEDVTTGGGSDGNFTSALGTPTLDGLGPLGGQSHNAAEEWLDEKSILPRMAMLATLVSKIVTAKPR
jgi:glutamate carboxypeptidase